MNRFPRIDRALRLLPLASLAVWGGARFALGQPAATSSAPTNGFQAYRLIIDRNIFDPNRTAPGSKPGRPTAESRPTESFQLVGTLSYEKGSFAFFDGSISGYRKSVSVSQTIDGFTVRMISQNSVTLEAIGQTTNRQTIVLPIGMELHKKENRWELGQAASPPSLSRNSSNTDTAGSAPAGESDLEKKMRLRREKEMRK